MAAAQWWVVNQISRPGGARGSQQTNYVIKQAAARPVNTVAGPYATKADAQAWQTSANTAGNSPGSAIGGVTNAAANATGLTAIGDFFSRLGQANTWIRAGEVVLGLVLLAVGVARLTNAVPIATKIAGVAAKGAIL
jgi:hypothetical protein